MKKRKATEYAQNCCKYLSGDEREKKREFKKNCYKNRAKDEKNN